MRKVIATMNITLDGYCDHTDGIVDDELHEHFNEVMKTAGTLLYGRKTYQLMEDAWPEMVKNPSGNKPMDDFAVLIDNIPKVVFSRSLKSVEWKSARLATLDLLNEIEELKQQPGKDILVGSPGLIAQCTNLNLIDEYQLVVHPVVVGRGLVLFRDLEEKKFLRMIRTKTLGGGHVVLYYEPTK